MRLPAAIAGLVCLALAPLAAPGAPHRGWFGMTVDVETESLFPSPTLRAATVTAVAEGSPAASGGLRVGDHIEAVDGISVRGAKARDLQATLAKNVGEAVRLHLVRRDGEPYAVVLVAVEKPR